MYDTARWAEAGPRLPLSTRDAADLAWSPAGGLLAVWDGPLAFKVGCVREAGAVAGGGCAGLWRRRGQCRQPGGIAQLHGAAPLYGAAALCSVPFPACGLCARRRPGPTFTRTPFPTRAASPYLLSAPAAARCAQVVLVDASSGAQLGCLAAPYGPDALGLKAVAWSPGGELLALGSYDGAARWAPAGGQGRGAWRSG